MMSTFDEVIHQSTRLRIMAALNLLSDGETLSFSQLKALLGVSDGNLGTHLDTLEKAAYIRITKQFVGKKPQTSIQATPEGLHAYRAHILQLKQLLAL
ncbi:transcriptional regulator [Chromobacterium sp. IIBBL 290-4]|uniref:transcriptional regulator n=1 Tax=Chromobacterium sp. IIBBL 290-4 TaxID=2953890 RepID=UPI0020B86C78|nr:transcriptional regulator [Chromobacterium sp. IIBBL 290-4]UTH74294.1 transcriptional regulator [Chromobacterium sp. IIBBL 290-4]